MPEGTRPEATTGRHRVPFPAVIGDFERPGRRRAAQDRALHRYLRTQVAPYSTRYGTLLSAQPVTSIEDLGALPLTTVADLTDDRDPSAYVLKPSGERIAASPDRRLRTSFWWARTTKRLSAFNREVIDPRYKPTHWHLAEPAAATGTVPATAGAVGVARGFPIGNSSVDLDRLASAGRHTLELAGVTRGDVLIGLDPPGPSPAFWQIALGARSAGVSSLFLDRDPEPEHVAALAPNVLAGSAGRLRRLLTEGGARGLSFAALHTLLVFGSPLDAATRQRLADLAGAPSRPVAVVGVWGPAGARALWAECRNGTDVHTSPAHEVLELIDPLAGTVLQPGTEGEVVYTPLGWHGSVVLRLRTGLFGALDDTPCVSCGRTSPRLRLVPFLPPFARVLDDHDGVALWQAEMRTVDDTEELIVYLTPDADGHPGALLRELDRQLSVTQFVVLDARRMNRRLAGTGDVKVIDSRA